MRIYILCNGTQERLRETIGARPKQLLRIGHRESIVERTLRMSVSWAGGGGVTLVAPDQPLWQALADKYKTRLFDPGRTSSLVQSLYRARQYASAGDYAVLLGDVVYSGACLSAVLDSGSSVRFVGRTGPNPATGKRHAELFGMYVPEWQAENMDDAQLVLSALEGRQGLWELYHRWTGLPGPQPSPYLRQVKDDWSDDIDSPEDLQHLDQLRRLAAENDPET